MPQSQRKRPHPPTPPSTRSSIQQRRQRLDYDTYAGLSTLWLTKNALRALDEYNKVAEARASISAPRVCARPPTPPPFPRDILRQVKRPSAALRKFARHGGPDLRDILQDAQFIPAMAKRKSALASSKNAQDSASKRSKSVASSSGPYDKNFEQLLIDEGILPHNFRLLPGRPDVSRAADYQAIRARIRAPRDNETFDAAAIDRLTYDITRSSDEEGFADTVMPVLEVRLPPARRGERAADRTFDKLAELIPGVDLKYAQPDVCYGARPDAINPLIRQRLSSLIVPSVNTVTPVAPNFFVALKGPDGTSGCAMRQAWYYGCLGARAIVALESYQISVPVYNEKMKAVSIAFTHGTLDIYGTYVVNMKTGKADVTYQTTLLRSISMKEEDGCEDGIRAFRNAIDVAREIRDEAIRKAHATFEAMRPHPIAAPPRGASNLSNESSSTDELSLDQPSMTTFGTKGRGGASRRSGGSN